MNRTQHAGFKSSEFDPRDAKPNGGAKPSFILQRLDKLVISTTVNYLIRGWLPRVGLGVIWGWYKSGKSFGVLDMALCIAHDREYHGKRCKSGPVVYIALEGGSRYPERIEAWHRINNVTERNAPFYLLSDVQLDLFTDSTALIVAIREQVAEAPVAVFIDTLNRAIAGSENKPEDMARFVRGCDALRIAFHCFVGVVHHSGAGGNDSAARSHLARRRRRRWHRRQPRPVGPYPYARRSRSRRRTGR